MSVLVSLGILTSYLFSLALTLFVPGQETFYEAAVTLAVFLLLGHWIEMKARRGSSDSVRKLLDLAPQTATVEREDRQVEVPVAEVRVGNGGWTLNRGAAIAVPPVIRELILERLSTLEPSARRVLELLSVWESTTPHRVLREAGDLDEDVLLNALHRLRAAHLVVEEVGPEGVCYATSHPLIQEVVHAELGAMARVRMHAAFARALEQWRPDDLERLAYHYRLAGTEANRGGRSRFCWQLASMRENYTRMRKPLASTRPRCGW